MAPDSSTLAWKIPWTEEPGGLPSMGWHRVGHDWSNLAAAAAAAVTWWAVTRNSPLLICNSVLRTRGEGKNSLKNSLKISIFRMGNTCIPVADSFWYLAKLIQFYKVKKKCPYLKNTSIVFDTQIHKFQWISSRVYSKKQTKDKFHRGEKKIKMSSDSIQNQGRQEAREKHIEND